MTPSSLRVAAAAAAFTTFAAQALAGPGDYEFQAGSGEIKAGKGRVVSIKLIDKRTKKPVSGAVFAQTSLDMSPENMAETKGRISPETSSDPAVYRFRGDFSMSGVWALKLQAKVPGESQPVQGVLILRASE